MVQTLRGAPDQTYRLGDNIVSGMYVVEVRQAGEVVTAKVIKQYIKHTNAKDHPDSKGMVFVLW